MKHCWSNEFDPTVMAAEGIYFIENGLFAHPIRGRAINFTVAVVAGVFGALTASRHVLFIRALPGVCVLALVVSGRAF